LTGICFLNNSCFVKALLVEVPDRDREEEFLLRLGDDCALVALLGVF
jgi:hypothetical protein